MDVRSYVTLSADAPKAGLKQLPLPKHVEAVRAVSKGTTGLERIYLEALNKNVTARREFNVLLQQSTQQSSPPRMHAHGTPLSEHVELLRLKKRNEELHVLQRYMTKLQSTRAARADFLGLKTIPRFQLGSLSPAHQHASGGSGQAVDSVDALVRRLEMAVISAKYKVDHEHRLLTEVEQDVSAIPVSVKQERRSCALAATRDELVTWIEDKLSGSQSNEKGLVDEGLQEQQTESLIPQIRSEIMEKYDQYIKVRKRMLDLISDCTIVTEQPQPEVQASKTKSNSPAPSSQTPSLSYLPFILTQIHHPTQLRQFHRQQTTHLSSLMNKERSKTTFELSRLADESHLLPEYPMLAQQDRFKHATTAIASKGLLASAVASDEEIEMSRTMEAWSFAADSAREATGEIVIRHLERGGEAVKEGERCVEKLRELLGNEGGAGQEKSRSGSGSGNGDGDSDQDDGEEYEDVWALEAAVGHLASSKQAVEGIRGPWAGIGGDVGLKKDT